MRRNCALTLKQLLWFYVFLVCLSLAVAAGFLMSGVSIVPIFTAPELTAVTIGFLIYCKHALDCETIEIEGTRLLVKKFIGYKETLYEFNTRWVKIESASEGAKTFQITQADLRVDLGQFIRCDQQLALIAQLRSRLG